MVSSCGWTWAPAGIGADSSWASRTRRVRAGSRGKVIRGSASSSPVVYPNWTYGGRLLLLRIGDPGDGSRRGLLELAQQVDEALDLLVDALRLGDHHHAVRQVDRGVRVLVPGLVAGILLHHL